MLRSDMRNERYHSLQNHLPSRRLRNNLGTKICRTVILPVGFLWVWNSVSGVNGNTTGGVREYGVEEDIWCSEGSSRQGLEKTEQWGVAWSVALTKYYSGNQSKENRMGMECGMHGERDKYLQSSGGWIWSKESTWKTSTYLGQLAGSLWTR